MSDPRHLVHEQDPFNAEVPISEVAMAPGEGALFVRSHFDVPDLRQDTHRVRVGGAVARPLELGTGDLSRYARRQVAVTMECAGNGRSLVQPRPPGVPWNLGAVGAAAFEGAALADVLEDAGVKDGAVEVLAGGCDAGKVGSGRVVSFERSLPLAVAMGQDVLLATAMNGAPLHPRHGFPVRLVVPGWYGVASVKWLERIEVRTEPFAGWFQRDSYVYDGEEGLPDGTPVGPMRVRALVTSPADGDVLPAGPVTVRGAAWSGGGRVVRVEISADEGASWIEATLASDRGPWLPRLWQATWTTAKPGPTTLLARATDASGAVQPLRPVWNRHGYGNHAVHRVAVEVR